MIREDSIKIRLNEMYGGKHIVKPYENPDRRVRIHTVDGEVTVFIGEEAELVRNQIDLFNRDPKIAKAYNRVGGNCESESMKFVYVNHIVSVEYNWR